MKVRFWKRHIYFTELDVVEFKWLKKKLTWVNERSGTSESLLFQNPKNSLFFTLDGLAEQLFKGCEYPVEIEDRVEEVLERTIIDPKYLKFDNPNDELYPYQVFSIQRALMNKRGILKLPTGAGKSEIMLAVLKYLIEANRITKALVIVPSAALLENICSRARERGLPTEWFGAWGDKRKDLSKLITVAITDSITAGWKNSPEATQEFLQSVDYLAAEEAHHLRARTWADIVWATSSEYLHAFTATPFQQDEVLESYGDSLVLGLCNKLIVSISNKHLIDIGATAQDYVCFRKMAGRGKYYAGNYSKLYEKEIVSCSVRNGCIVQDTKLALQYGLATFIMVEHHEHAETLMKALTGYKVIAKFGGNTSLQFDEYGSIQEVGITISTLKSEFLAGTWDVLIGSPAMGTGVDISRINFMIMAAAGKSRIAVVQRRGRAVRKKKHGPNQVFIRDYSDMSHAYFKSQAKQRRAHYEMTDSIIIEDEQTFWQMVYEHGQAMKQFSDVSNTGGQNG